MCTVLTSYNGALWDIAVIAVKKHTIIVYVAGGRIISGSLVTGLLWDGFVQFVRNTGAEEGIGGLGVM